MNLFVFYKKTEGRIRDVEIEFEEEKRRHVETQKILRKKEHRVKELCLQSEEGEFFLNSLFYFFETFFILFKF